jgi:hypothetical protein
MLTPIAASQSVQDDGDRIPFDQPDLQEDFISSSLQLTREKTSVIRCLRVFTYTGRGVADAVAVNSPERYRPEYQSLGDIIPSSVQFTRRNSPGYAASSELNPY